MAGKNLTYRADLRLLLFGAATLVTLAAACSYARQYPAAVASELAGGGDASPVHVEMIDFSEKTGQMSGLVESASYAGRKVVRLSLDRGPIEVPTADIGRMIVQPSERLLVKSNDGVRTFFLGHGRTKAPEPPGWYLPESSVNGWKTAVAQWPHAGWRYIPQAIWIWADRPRHHYGDETVLFRHDFDVPTTMSIIGARLDVGADVKVESFFINGTPVRLPNHNLSGRVSQWDVTHLMRPGRNVVAARVTNGAGSGRLNHAGFCYRILCDLLPGDHPDRPSPAGAILFLANGDRLSGHLEGVDPKKWRLRREGQVVVVDRDWIALALVSYDGAERKEEIPAARSRAGVLPLLTPWKVFAGSRPIRPAITLSPMRTTAWNRNIEPVRAREGILARNGDWIEGRIEGLRENRVLIKPRYGELFGIPVDRVSVIQPNRPDPGTQFLYRPSDFPYVVEVRLANNDRVTGAMEALTPNAITLTPHFTDSIRLAIGDVLSVDFKMNMMAQYRYRLAGAWAVRAPRLVAAIGESDQSLPSGIDKSILVIQRTLQNLGLEMRWLRADQIVETGRLTPERFPVLLNFDQNQRYFHTVAEEGDGFGAIAHYVRQGGTLVHLARGAPFSRAYVADRGRWRVQRPPRDLNADLMMQIHEKPVRRAKPFELPPNRGQRMFFVLERSSAFAKGLPEMVDVPMIEDIRFRPITDDAVTTPATFHPVYRLVDNTGEDYGTAMAVIQYGTVDGRPHYGFYASHLLCEAEYEGQSMIEFLLPKAISLALGVDGVSIANLADRDPDSADRKAADLPDPSARRIPPPIPPERP